jgi:predicted lipid-binding transport protein (Tim44 family)
LATASGVVEDPGVVGTRRPRPGSRCCEEPRHDQLRRRLVKPWRKKSDPEPGSSPDAPAASTIRAGLDALVERDPTFELEPFLASCTETFTVAQRAWTERQPELTRDRFQDVIWDDHRRQIEQFVADGKRNVIDELAVDEVQVVAVDREHDLDSITVRFFARCADYDVDLTTPEPVIVRGTTTVEEWAEDWVFQRFAPDGTSWLLARIEQLPTYEDAIATLPDPAR